MKKSLTPLIIAFVAIILVTMVVLNTRKFTKKVKEKESGDLTVLNLADFDSPEWVASIPDSDSAIRPEPESESSISLARNLLAEGLKKEAEEELRNLLVFEPENIHALSLLGSILFYSGRLEEAEKLIRRQISLNPGSAVLFNKLSVCLMEQERLNAAMRYGIRAWALSPDSPHVLLTLARMYSRMNRRREALEHFSKAFEILGPGILPLAGDPDFDNIRNEAKFQEILLLARSAGEKAGMEESP